MFKYTPEAVQERYNRFLADEREKHWKRDVLILVLTTLIAFILGGISGVAIAHDYGLNYYVYGFSFAFSFSLVMFLMVWAIIYL